MIRAVLRNFSRFCSGCGSAFQHTDELLEGFIPENRYKNTLVQNLKAESTLEQIKKNEDVKLKDFKLTHKSKPSDYRPSFEEIDSIEEIEERMKSAIPLHDFNLKPKIKPLICMRCYKLSNYGQLTETKAELSLKSPETLMTDIFGMIKFNSIIIKVVDLLDFNGSLIEEIFLRAAARKSHVILVLNKIDALPSEAKIERIYRWALDQTRGLFKDLDVVPLSARTGDGYDKLIRILKELRESLPNSKVYVVGATNSGKSSFINQLARKCWKLPKEKFKSPELTTSAYAGTTLVPIEVSLRALDMKIVDTPGIPTISQITFNLTPDSARLIIPNKKIKPLVVTITPDFVVWIGAVARVGMTSGDFKYLTFFGSHMCTMHKTRKDKAEEVFEKQAGKLLQPAYVNEPEWETHTIELNCTTKEKATKDFVIHGLGWVSVTGFGICSFEVRVAKGVGFNIRDPLMPFEAKPELVQFTKGKTLNSEKYRRKMEQDKKF